MFKQKETWAIKRHISPEPQLHNIDKLNYMQENLSVAAETIHALKLERDNLKESLRTALGDNKASSERVQVLNSSRSSGRNIDRDNLKKQALKEELQNLTRIAKEKDKMIEMMEKKLEESKVDKKG